MKVNFFADFCYPGGLTIHQGEVAAVLHRTYGVDVRLCVPWPLPHDIAAHRELLETAENLSHIYEPLRYLRKIRTAAELQSLIEEADINHFHGTFTTGRPFLQQAIAQSPVHKNVYTFHSAAPNPEFYSDDRQLQANLGKVSRIFAVSDCVRQSVLHMNPHLDIMISENAPSPYKACGKKSAKDRVTLLYAGRLNKTKGIENVIYAAERLHDLNIDIIIMGQAEFHPEYEATVQALAAKNPWIRLVPGPLARVDMQHLYEEADIFYCPSQSEGGPLVVLEALHAGCAVIATPVGVVPRYVKEGENGFIRSFEDQPGQLAAIRRLVENHAMLARMQEQAKQTELPRWEETAAILYHQYEELTAYAHTAYTCHT